MTEGQAIYGFQGTKPWLEGAEHARSIHRPNEMMTQMRLPHVSMYPVNRKHLENP